MTPPRKARSLELDAAEEAMAVLGMLIDRLQPDRPLDAKVADAARTLISFTVAGLRGEREE